MTQQINYLLLITKAMANPSWLQEKMARFAFTTSRLDNWQRLLRVALVACPDIQIVSSVPSSWVKIQTWLCQAVGTRMSKYGTLDLASASEASLDLSLLATPSMCTMALSWLVNTHSPSNCSCGTWVQVTWQKTFHSTRNCPQHRLCSSTQLNSRRTPMTWSWLVALALMRSKSSTATVSLNLATESTTCRGRASQQTSATVATCLRSAVETESCVSLTLPKSAEQEITV